MTTPIQTSGSNRNRLVLVGALAAVVLLAAVLLPRMLFGGGGGDELGDPPEVSGSPDSTTTTAAPGGVAAAPSPEAFSTKNPFAPLVDTSPAATAAGTGTTGEASDVPGSGTGTTGTGTTGTGTTGTGATGTAAGTGTGSGAGTEPVASGRFSLLDVYAGPDGAPAATVEVDGQMYTVSEGDTFAGGYTVVSLSIEEKRGVFTSPADGGSFSPSTGESVLK